MVTCSTSRSSQEGRPGVQQSFKRTLAGVLLAVFLVIGAAIAARYAFRSYDAFQLSREADKLHKVQPSPEHSPADVVRFQLAALSQVDQPHPGAGIELVYAFLSPDQRDTPKDLDQLTALFNQPPFNHLVGFKTAKLDVTRISGNHAQQPVLVQTQDNLLVAYVFLLTRQEEGENAGAWMTVGLLPMKLQIGAGAPPPVAEASSSDG